MLNVKDVKNLKPTERAQLVSAIKLALDGKKPMVQFTYTKQTNSTSRATNAKTLLSKEVHAGLLTNAKKNNSGEWFLTLMDVNRGDFTNVKLPGITNFRKIGEVKV